MNGFVPERSAPWNTFFGPNSSFIPPDGGALWKSRALWKCLNAIYYCLVAIFILFLMFLLKPLFKHLFGRTIPSLSSSSEEDHAAEVSLEAGQRQKLVNQDQFMVTIQLMPGEFYPTHFAQPAPLPCPREGLCWPSHEM